MNHTRKGKIARLPSEIREELNCRLQDGQPLSSLAKWLNSQPNVCEIMEEEFGGRGVQEQNISAWRKGGYREWVARQEAMEAVGRVNEDLCELIEGTGLDFTDNVALWLSTRYVSACQKMEEEKGQVDWKKLREFCHDIVALRRGDHTVVRLRIDEKRQRAQEFFAKNRWNRRIIQGMEALEHYVKKHPQAKKAFDALAEAVKDKFDHIRTWKDEEEWNDAGSGI